MTGPAARIRVRVWDLPTRLFHWLLAFAVAGAYGTGETGGNWLVWHGHLGIFIIGLLAFRLAWGLIGPTYARFANFFPTPARLRAYLAGRWQGLGHNPLGSLSVFALLGLVALQAATGLFSYNDDIGYGGYLYALVDTAANEQFTALHHQIFYTLVFLVSLHVAAIAFYARVKKDNLVKAMITGEKEVEARAQAEGSRGGGVFAIAMALGLAAAAAWGAAGTWASPPPPPAAAAPAW